MPVLRRFSHTLLFLALAFLTGCTYDAPSVADAPINGQEAENNLLSRVIPPILIDNLLLQPMPVATSPRIRQDAVVLVTPQSGGELTAALSYNSFQRNKVVVTSTLSIPPGAVSQNVTITMSIDTATAGVTFKPEGLRFNTTVFLDYKSAGLSILGPLITSMNFYYVNPNGPCELVPNSGISINLPKGKISLSNARLNHFSAYAFGRVY